MPEPRKQKEAPAQGGPSKAAFMASGPIEVVVRQGGKEHVLVGKPRSFSSGKVGYNLSEKVPVTAEGFEGERMQAGINLVVIGSAAWRD